jgi:hypothetical protein
MANTMKRTTAGPSRVRRRTLSTCGSHVRQFGVCSGFLFGAVMFMVLTGCATRQTSQDTPTPGEGLTEYHQLAVRFQESLGALIGALDQLRAQTNDCAPGVVENFSEKVEKLHVESVQVRARAQAIEARGTAYFQHWEDTLARVADARKRELAVQHHRELEQSFHQLKMASQQTRVAFRPFSSGVRQLRNTLESDAGAVRKPVTQELLQATLQSGRQTDQSLAVVRSELEKMTAMLTPFGAGTKP